MVAKDHVIPAGTRIMRIPFSIANACTHGVYVARGHVNHYRYTARSSSHGPRHIQSKRIHRFIKSLLFHDVFSRHKKIFFPSPGCTSRKVFKRNLWVLPKTTCGRMRFTSGSLLIEAMYVTNPLRPPRLARSPHGARRKRPVRNTVPTNPVR